MVNSKRALRTLEATFFVRPGTCEDMDKSLAAELGRSSTPATTRTALLGGSAGVGARQRAVL